MILASEWILFPKQENKRLCIVLIIIGVLLYVFISRMLHVGISIFWQSFQSESHDGDILTPAHYFLTQMRVFLTFLRLLILPIHQNLDYDYPASTGLFHPPLTIGGLGVIAGFMGLIIKLRRQRPLIAFGLAWMLITFSINLAPRSNVIFEHKLYLISFGFFIALVATLSLLVSNRATLVRILLCVSIVFAILSFNRNKVWATELTLWQECIKESPNKARVNANLGRVYGSLGQYDKAIYYLSRSIASSPDNITYENRGVIYSREGKYTQALEDLNKSIAMDPSYFTTYVKRSWIYQNERNYNAALDDLARAILLNPYFTDAYIERGMLWIEIGQYPQAVKDFQQVLNIDPFNYEILMKQGEVYLSLKRYDLALEDFRKAKALEPTSVEAAQDRSYCLVKMGQLK